MRLVPFASILWLLGSAPYNVPNVGAQPAPALIEGSTYELALSVDGVRSSEGQIRAELLGQIGGETKPRTITFAVQDAKSGVNVIRFKGLAAGQYAVQLYHDENANGKVDLNLVGVPVEGYAFSNTPIVQGGIPPFAKMSIEVSEDSKTTAVMAYAP